MNTKQEEALREYLKEAIVPLIEQVLVKKLGQAMSFAASELVQPQRTWVGLTDEEELQLAQDSMAYTRHWLVAQVETKLKEKNAWQDGDCKHCVNGCPACDARRQPNVLP